MIHFLKYIISVKCTLTFVIVGYAPIPVGLSAASSQNVAASGPQPMASQSQQRASQPQPPQKASQPQQGMPQPQQRAPQPQQRAPQPPQAGAVPAAAQVPGARPKEYTEQQINKLACRLLGPVG